MIDLSYKYYVYAAYGLEGEVLYVGQGKGNRWQHCVSGASSNTNINRYYFNNGEGDCIKVKILERFRSKQRALKRETQLIEKYLPSCNKLGVTTENTDNMTELSLFYVNLKNRFADLVRKDLKDESNKYSNGVSISSYNFEIFTFTFGSGDIHRRSLHMFPTCSQDHDDITEAYKVIFSIGYWGKYDEIMLIVADAVKEFGDVYYDFNDCDDLDFVKLF